jgi:hypothetical protein
MARSTRTIGTILRSTKKYQGVTNHLGVFNHSKDKTMPRSTQPNKVDPTALPAIPSSNKPNQGVPS